MKLLGKLFVSLLVFIAVCCLAEGGASLLTVVQEVSLKGFSSGSFAQNDFKYDAVLGWAPTPGVRGEPGEHNQQGFRHTDDITKSPSANSVRILCSGDSMTYGSGVSQGIAWCGRLESLTSDTEAINLGVPGYGVDQSYLRYQRDALEIKHHIHLFAFIRNDIDRVAGVSFLNVPKPRFDFDHRGKLIVDNTLPPVGPSIGRSSSLIPSDLLSQFAKLRILQLFRDKPKPKPGVFRFILSPYLGPWDVIHSAQKTEQLTLALFEEIERVSRKRGAIAVFIFLPMAKDILPNWDYRVSERDRLFWQSEMNDRNFNYLDLTNELRKYREETRLFLPDYHYSPEGHELVANTVMKYLEKRNLLSAKPQVGPKQSKHGTSP